MYIYTAFYIEGPSWSYKIILDLTSYKVSFT